MCGLMEGGSKGNGRTTICMGEECILGKMAGGTRESTRTTGSMAMEYIRGRMAGSMRATGVMANNMDKGLIDRQEE
jgi:hypothetical protein